MQMHSCDIQMHLNYLYSLSSSMLKSNPMQHVVQYTTTHSDWSFQCLFLSADWQPWSNLLPSPCAACSLCAELFSDVWAMKGWLLHLDPLHLACFLCIWGNHPLLYVWDIISGQAEHGRQDLHHEVKSGNCYDILLLLCSQDRAKLIWGKSMQLYCSTHLL